MLKAGDVLDLRPLGAVFTVRKSADETKGASLEMEWELAPRSGGTPVHVHPDAVETYEVLEGELDVQLDGAWRTLPAGERLAVEKGRPHTFRNASDRVARVLNTHAPALRFEEYFDGLADLVRRDVLRSPRPSPKAMMHLAILMTRFPQEIQTVAPPPAVLRAMARVGRALGYRA